MSRPPAETSADSLVDATVCARAGSRIERRFSVADLPRLAEIVARAGSAIDASFQFSLFDNRPAVDGALSGAVMLTCQRCMQAVSIPVDERFQVLVMTQEREDEPGGYESVVADPTRLDLRWLVEDQLLLALPLVPMHETGECTDAVAKTSSQVEHDADGRQQPFANLRDMLRRR